MSIYRITGLLLTLSLISMSYCTNKIVYLISPPRSLSVAFLRMMQARGDFSIMHEPSQSVLFARTHPAEVFQDWFRSDAFQSYDEVKAAILQKAENNNLFIKEISFGVRDFHCQDFQLMQNPNAYFVFLVRSPHHTIISMYKKLKDNFSDLSIPFCDLIGYKEEYDIFMTVKNHGSHQPYLIFTEDLYTNPDTTIQKFCDHVGIAFKPESLHWDDLGESFDGQEQWQEAKHAELAQYWHGDAIHSTGFAAPAPYAVDEQGNPTFSEIANLEHRETCAKIYCEQMIYYCQLLENYE